MNVEGNMGLLLPKGKKGRVEGGVVGNGSKALGGRFKEVVKKAGGGAKFRLRITNGKL